MHDTLHYFFSTMAQAFAAFVAFVFTAALSRIGWIDNKISACKVALIYKMYPDDTDAVPRKSAEAATAIIKEARSLKDEYINPFADELEDYVRAMQALRESSRNLIVLGILTSLTGLSGIILSPYVENDPCASKEVLFVGMLLSSISAFFIAKFVVNSLKVGLRNKL